jgi:O-antigen/teichoic acid export membrane protein
MLERANRRGTETPDLPSPTGARRFGKTTLAGVGWLLAQTASSRVIALGSQIIMARILLPADFAIVGLAGTVTAIVWEIVNFGVDDVLLQRQKRMHYWATPAFLTSLSLGIFSMLITVAAAPVVAKIYKAPLLLIFLPIVALSMPISALSTVPYVKIRASLNFRLLATWSMIEMASTQVLTIALALNGLGVYSFCIPLPAIAAVRAVVYWLVAKPTLHRMRTNQLRMMSASSSAVFGTRILTAAVAQGDYFILGLLAAPSVVGAYYFAFRLAIQPVQMLAGSFSNVLFPALAQLGGYAEQQREVALKASRLLSAVVMPYCFLQAAVAQPIIGTIFGSKWQDSIPLVQILSIGLGFDAVSWVAGAVMSARGHFQRTFSYSCVFSPIFFLVVLLGATFASALGVATAVSLFYLVLAPVYSYLVFSRAGVGFGEIAQIYVAPTVCAALASAGAYLLSASMTSHGFAQILGTAVLGGTFYIALSRLIFPREFRTHLRHIRTVLKLEGF